MNHFDESNSTGVSKYQEIVAMLAGKSGEISMTLQADEAQVRLMWKANAIDTGSMLSND